MLERPRADSSVDGTSTPEQTSGLAEFESFTR